MGNRTNAEERKEQILNKATEVFARHGYDGTRIWQIAQECNISEGTVLHFFKNKRQLQRATFFHVLSNSIVIPDLSNGNLEDMLISTAERILSKCKKDPGMLRFMLQTFLSEPEQTEYYHQSPVVQDLQVYLKEGIYRGKTSMGLKDTDSNFVVTCFLGMVIWCAMVNEFFGPDEISNLSSKDAAASITDLFLSGLSYSESGQREISRN